MHKENQQNFSLTNGQFIQQIKNNPIYDKQIEKTVKNNQQTNQQGKIIPVLKIIIDSIDVEDYDFEYEDLKLVFENFGQVKNIDIQPNGQAYIEYIDLKSAFIAFHTIQQNKQIENNIKLCILWVYQQEYEQVLQKQYVNLSTKQIEIIDDIQVKQSNSKYTCRYDIPIENCKEFGVARRIIGNKGCNMKKIIQKALQNKTCEIKNNPDSIKLRLRGKGSGFKEGPEQKESNEQLHLCVSSKYFDIYKMVCEQVDELIENIYQEFQIFCERNQKPFLIENKNNCLKQKEQLENEKINQKKYSSEENNNNLQEIQLSNSIIEKLIEDRNKARRMLNFQEADRIRNFLKNKGIILIDEKGRRGNAFDVTSWRMSSDYNQSFFM